MNLSVDIILGSGRPLPGSDLAAVQKTSRDRRVLDWILRNFEDALEGVETLRIENGTVTEIGAEPDGHHEIDGQYTGLIKVRDDHVHRFINAYETLDRESIHMTWFLQHLIDEGWDVAPVAVDGGWLEVDTIADLDTYQALLESETTSKHISALTE